MYALNLHVNKNNTKICLDTVYSYRQSSLKGTSFVIFLMLAPNTYSIQSAYFIWCIQHWINKAIVAFVCVFELPLLRSVLVYVAKIFISFWFVQTFCVFTIAFFSLSLPFQCKKLFIIKYYEHYCSYNSWHRRIFSSKNWRLNLTLCQKNVYFLLNELRISRVLPFFFVFFSIPSRVCTNQFFKIKFQKTL